MGGSSAEWRKCRQLFANGRTWRRVKGPEVTFVGKARRRICAPLFRTFPQQHEGLVLFIRLCSWIESKEVA